MKHSKSVMPDVPDGAHIGAFEGILAWKVPLAGRIYRCIAIIVASIVLALIIPGIVAYRDGVLLDTDGHLESFRSAHAPKPVQTLPFLNRGMLLCPAMYATLGILVVVVPPFYSYKKRQRPANLEIDGVGHGDLFGL